MKRTPLYDQHVRDASAVINLKGFARAMQYRGHAVEHRATREQVTLCDVSHMGELEFKGPDALALVQKLITNDAGTAGRQSSPVFGDVRRARHRSSTTWSAIGWRPIASFGSSMSPRPTTTTSGC